MANLMNFYDNALSHLIDTSENFNKKQSLKEHCHAYTSFNRSLIMMAYASLLSFADINKFYKLLMCCAFNWKNFLSDCLKRGDENRIPASLNTPFFCALICGRFDVASEIANLSSTILVPPEYDDEFYSARFLYEYTLFGVETPDQKEKLEGYCSKIIEYLEYSPRFVTFYRSLIESSVEEKWNNFRDWNIEISDAVNMKAEAPYAGYPFGIIKYIWMEGLGILKLLGHKGIQLHGNFSLIPAISIPVPKLNYDESFCILGKSEIYEESFLS